MGSFSKQHQAGVTLIELMVTLAIIGIVSAIAFPLYQDYLDTSRAGVIENNIQTIRLMQDERRREFGEYVEGVYAPGGSTTLTTNLGWSPRSSVDEITYTVTCATDGAKTGECTRASGYTVVGSHSAAPSATVSRTYTP